MSNNCFVTKLADAIPNDLEHNQLLHKIDEVVIPVTFTKSGDSVESFRMDNGIVKLLSGNTVNSVSEFNDKGGAKIYFNNITANSQDYIKVRLFDEVTNIIASNITPSIELKDLLQFPNIDTININDWMNLTGDISELADYTDITTLRLIRTGVTGDIKSISNLTNVTYLGLNSIGLTATMKDFVVFKNATSINLPQYTTGTIENYADEVAKDKVSRVVKFILDSNLSPRVSYNGATGTKRQWTVTFNEDGTYTAENTDIS